METKDNITPEAPEVKGLTPNRQRSAIRFLVAQAKACRKKAREYRIIFPAMAERQEGQAFALMLAARLIHPSLGAVHEHAMKRIAARRAA